MSGTMSDLFFDALPPPQRFALSYTPAHAHRPVFGLLALDSRFGQLVRQRKEPVLAQMRLAWWRETLAQNASDRTVSDPLLEILADWSGEEASLVALVDGWEELLADAPLRPDAIACLAEARGDACAALARLVGVRKKAAEARNAGRCWALADLAIGFSDPDERRLALAAGREAVHAPIHLPRALRSLTILAGLARRSIGRDGTALLDGPGAMALAVRLGIFGR